MLLLCQKATTVTLTLLGASFKLVPNAAGSTSCVFPGHNSDSTRQGPDSKRDKQNDPPRPRPAKYESHAASSALASLDHDYHTQNQSAQNARLTNNWLTERYEKGSFYYDVEAEKQFLGEIGCILVDP